MEKILLTYTFGAIVLLCIPFFYPEGIDWGCFFFGMLYYFACELGTAVGNFLQPEKEQD